MSIEGTPGWYGIDEDEADREKLEQEALCSGIINDLKSRDDKISSLNKELEEYKTKIDNFKVFRPAQITSGICKSISDVSNMFKKNIHIEGIFLPGYNKPYYYNGLPYFFDTLKNKEGNDSITILVQQDLHNKLAHQNNIIQLNGRIECNQDLAHGYVKIHFRVDGLDKITTQTAFNEDDIKRIEILKQKNAKGRKNVLSIIENIMMKGEKPHICLVFAASSITDKDFNKGIQNDFSSYNFEMKRVTFTAASLTNELRSLDTQKYDAICLIRGGGSGLDTLDDIEILKCAATLNTPFIAALGHDADKLYLKDIADYASSTPDGLGRDFFNLRERVSMTLNNSKDAIRKQVENEFKKLIDEKEKTNIQQKTQYEKQLKDKDKALADLKESHKKSDEQNKTLLDNKDKQIKDKDKQIEDEIKTRNTLKDTLQFQIKTKDEKIKELSSKRNKGMIISLILLIIIAISEFIYIFNLWKLLKEHCIDLF